MDVLLQQQPPLYTANHVNLFQEFNYEDDEDDDVFYTELKKQVLQLTAEDDDEDHNHDDDDDDDRVYAVRISELGAKPQKPGPINPVYYGWPTREIRAAPAWISNIGRTGNGTGVFIPQTVQSKRRHRSRRKKNDKKSKQQVEKTA